jgi:DNA polymerase-3 subunit gamma/tau
VSEALALRYRPRKFADVAGQMQVVGILYRMAVFGNVPPILLFMGSRGSGKTSTARILAAALNCELEKGPPEQWPCTTCPSCKSIAAGSSLDVMEMDAASNGRVEEIRDLKNLVSYSATSRKRVVLLDEAQSMSKEANNALLKVLEEPPPDTVFILLTTEPAKILQTVVSRCMQFEFHRLPAQVIAHRLQVICEREGIQAEPPMLAAIAERADGALRDAVVRLDQMNLAGVHDLIRYRALMSESDFAPSLVEAMVRGDHVLLFERLDSVLSVNGDFAAVGARIVSCLRDILVLQGGGRIDAQGEGLAMRMQLANLLDPMRVTRAMGVLWDLRTKTGRTDPRSTMELACVMCLERLHRQQAAAVSNGHNPLSMAQIRELAG